MDPFRSSPVLSRKIPQLLLNGRRVLTESAFVEMVAWRLDEALPGSAHTLKYRLALVVDGLCVLRYDNESLKGDHKHVGDREEDYIFTTAEALLRDCWQDLDTWSFDMNMVTLEVASREKSNARFISALKGKTEGAFITFDSPALLFKIFSGKRWDLLKAMAGAGPMTIREAARRAGRDVKAVHGDIQSLLKVGILEKTAEGKVFFPFDTMHVDFMLNVA